MPHSRDIDNLYDDAPVSRLEIVCRRNGALSVAGSIDNLEYALAMLDNAKDALRNHHSRRAIVIPANDVALPRKVEI
jgi:hypothetical protein